MHAVAGAQEATSVGQLWLTDFRCFTRVDLELTPGLTVLHGANGQGKTSLLEAITWVARTRSFRGVADSLARTGGRERSRRARRDRHRRTAPTLRSRSPRQRPESHHVQSSTGHPGARSARVAARHSVLSGRPCVGQRRSVGTTRVSRRAAVDVVAALRGGAWRLRPGLEATERAVTAAACATTRPA